MYAKRIPFINSLDLSDEDLRPSKFAEMQPPDVANPSDNLKNLFEDGELVEDSVVKESLTTAADGKGYQTKLYNLDANIGRDDVQICAGWHWE